MDVSSYAEMLGTHIDVMDPFSHNAVMEKNPKY